MATITTTESEHLEAVVDSHAEAPQEVSHETTIFAEPIGHIGGFTVTNAFGTSLLALLILVFLAVSVRRKVREVPQGIQNLFEILIEGSLSLCDQVTGSRKVSMRVLPVALAVFLFVLVNNWMGLIPGVGSVGVIENHDGHAVFVPFLRGGTADVNMTLALSVLSVIGANIFGIVSIGAWKTFNKYFNLKILGQIFTKFRKDPTIAFVAPITFFIGLIEFVGEFAKVASLSFRLFGNVFAGEVLLASMSALLAFGVPIPFIFLEVLVGFIQALIFAMLTVVYYTIAAHDHEHDEHEGGAKEPHAEMVEEGIVTEAKPA